jgi:hypothetical protein
MIVDHPREFSQSFVSCSSPNGLFSLPFGSDADALRDARLVASSMTALRLVVLFTR